MIVECTKFDDIWRKAKSNVGEEGLHSTYSWSEGVVSVILNHIGERVTIENSQQAPAIFFDNIDYPIWIEFKDYVKKHSSVPFFKMRMRNLLFADRY